MHSTQGMMPALKYMVTATNRNQTFRFHMVSRVSI